MVKVDSSAFVVCSVHCCSVSSFSDKLNKKELELVGLEPIFALETTVNKMW